MSLLSTQTSTVFNYQSAGRFISKNYHDYHYKEYYGTNRSLRRQVYFLIKMSYEKVVNYYNRRTDFGFQEIEDFLILVMF